MALPTTFTPWTSSDATFLPHDLLRVSGVPIHFPNAPDWVPACLERAPWLVVRRVHAVDGRVPVGIRGRTREERFAGWLDVQKIEAHLRPEALQLPAASLERPDVPAMGLARLIAPLLLQRGLCWGPTGSVGFECASTVPTAHARSDLDFIIRWDRSLDRVSAGTLLVELERLSAKCGNCKVDVHIETAAGAFSLAEYARGTGTVLMRSVRGPILVDHANLGLILS